MHYRRADGNQAELDQASLTTNLQDACADLGPDVTVAPILKATLSALYNGISEAEITQAAIMAARAQVEAEPAYTFVAARLLLRLLFQEAVGQAVSRDQALAAYQDYFPRYIQQAVDAELLDPALLSYDLGRLGAALAYPSKSLKSLSPFQSCAVAP